VSFLLDVVVDLLARTMVWLAGEAALAGAVAAAVWWVAGILDRPVPWWRTAIAALIGALAAASLAHRFDLVDPGHLEIWRRPIYAVWSFLGALAGSLASLLPLRIRPVP
jgi:hypothetical protein